MLSSLLNIFYLLPIAIRGFFAKPQGVEEYTEVKEAPKSMLFALSVTALVSIALFFYPDPFYNLAASAAKGN
jgi:multicomponent Na+:H+ antiporter subunit D